jgi:TolB-like protein
MEDHMKRIAFSLLFFSICLPIFADMQESVIRLLTSISRQFVEEEEQIYFRQSLAIVPFEESGPLVRKHEIGAVVEGLLRKELALSTYFILTERENLERIIEELKFSLTGLAAEETAPEAGKLIGTSLLLAGSITEAGDNFLINGRLIDVETGVVIGSEVVSIPKEELIEEARLGRYDYISRYGLGIYAGAGTDFVLRGTPAGFKNSALIALSGSFSYRPLRFLQLTAGFTSTWTEIQTEIDFIDVNSASYANSTLLQIYSTESGEADVLHYGFEHSQQYLDLQVHFVLNPVKQLAISFGGGGILGMMKNYIKMSLPVYIGLFFNGEPVPAQTLFPENYIEKSVTLTSGNGLVSGFCFSGKIEYFLSPRVLLFLKAAYKKTYSGDVFRYHYGGTIVNPDEPIPELSNWVPGITPFGDSLELTLDILEAQIGVSVSF